MSGGPAHLDAGLARAHVAAAQPQAPHAREGELAQVALLDAAGDEGHGDVALDAVHAHPRGDQRQQPRHLRRARMMRLTLSASHISADAQPERDLRLLCTQKRCSRNPIELWPRRMNLPQAQASISQQTDELACVEGGLWHPSSWSGEWREALFVYVHEK